jgi:hypothetical protein
MTIIPERSRNDPTPEARSGDSSFLPVVIVSCVVILLILIGAIVFIRSRKEKAVPPHSAPHTTSEIIQPSSAVHLNGQNKHYLVVGTNSLAKAACRVISA